MAEFSFNLNIILTVLLLLQVEFFFFLAYEQVINFNQTLMNQKTSKTNQLGVTYNANALFYLFFGSLIFFKAQLQFSILWILYICLVIYFTEKVLKKFFFNVKIATNFFSVLLPLIVGFFVFLFITKSLLVFFFLIELYGVLYYFIFLTNYNFSNQTLLKYKNGIIILLWNNFLTTFCIALGSFFIIKSYGSTDFIELQMLTVNPVYIFLYLVGLSWKIGLPLFHFLKLEVYKILLRENVFLFSIITTVINLMLLYFLLSQPVIFNAVYLHNWLIIVFCFLIILVVTNLKLYNILNYFALSGVLTSATLLVITLL